mmetsp:Transcript_13589/g.25776  ORF Transcript_13589/g.25776 Transcript_13589/m.25776 type:complete len:168 (-) Transcript_13589:357-860(-)
MDASEWKLAAEHRASPALVREIAHVGRHSKNVAHFAKNMRDVYRRAKPCVDTLLSLAEESRSLASSGLNLLPRVQSGSSGEHLGVLMHFGRIQQLLTHKHIMQLEKITSSLRSSIAKSELLTEELGRFVDASSKIVIEAQSILSLEEVSLASYTSPSLYTYVKKYRI